ncbi:MAG TPA: proprotein convertase P-domain-containing protein, partial [Gemmatales bacterium]|nr:proprotein convertase P-domain-containing protein [Gemmatales bacterium]
PPTPPPQDLTGALVSTMTSLITNNKLNGLRITFNEAIQPGSFDKSDVIGLTGPSGSVAVTTIRPLTGSTTQFDVLFADQSRVGNYSLTLGTGILDTAGNALNQNGNAINGENPGDRYAGSVNFNPTVTYPALNVPAMVRDYTVNTYTMNVPDSNVIGAVRVTIKVSHGWMSDMVIKLRSPSGKEVLLANRRGNGGKGYNNTVFDDGALKSLSQGGGLFTGSFRPELPLSVFKGSSTKGTWSLIIEDKARGDAGALLAWSLSFDSASGSSIASSIDNHDIATVEPDVIAGIQATQAVIVQPIPAQPLATVSTASKVRIATQQEMLVVTSKIQQQKQQLLKAWQEQLGLSVDLLNGVHVGLTHRHSPV